MNPMKKVLAEAAALDTRRQEQIQNQINSINRLLAVNTALQSFIDGQGLTEVWTEYRQEYLDLVTDHAGPCGICGAPNDHLGLPHSLATGDGRTRADVTATAEHPDE